MRITRARLTFTATLLLAVLAAVMVPASLAAQERMPAAEVASQMPSESPPQLPEGTQEALSETRDHIEAQRYKQAIARIAPVIGDARMPPEIMAAAFLLRGAAQQGLKNDRAALADFNDALWLQSLPAGFRAQAHSLRAQSLMVLGRAGEALADARLAEGLDPKTRQYAELRQAIEKFMGDTSPTLTASIPRAGGKADEAEAPAAAPLPAPADGRFGIQLGAMNSMQLAKDEWQRMVEAHGDLLGKLTPDFRTTGDGRNLVRLRAGPAASMEAARSLCNQLQMRGQDCFPIQK